MTNEQLEKAKKQITFENFERLREQSAASPLMEIDELIYHRILKNRKTEIFIVTCLADLTEKCCPAHAMESIFGLLISLGYSLAMEKVATEKATEEEVVGEKVK